MLKTLLRVLLWLILLVALIAGVAFLLFIIKIPKTQVFAGLAILAALLLGLVLLRRFVTRRHRRLQIEQIVTLDARSLDDAPKDRQMLENRWARAAAILKNSYLGRFGNPVYALPWYMVMGRTGAGKSSAISHSGLNAMLTDLGPDPDHPSTRNCDWFFFHEAVVLDTAGRYTVALDEAVDSAEWRDFLLQLAKYRRKEPLNGLVIAVAADTLYGDGDHLLPDARCLRRRLDEIMRTLGAKFPVYLMVTKIDLPVGMARVLEDLPPELRKQSVGKILQSPDKKDLIPVAVQIKRAIDEILDHFRSLCLFAHTNQQTPHGILAWEEIKSVMPALSAFAEELFTESPYQETPLLRGIFFSSALRSGVERQSHAFPRLNALVRRLLKIRESGGGVFLHDFFSSILPDDRNLNVPIAEYLRWRSSTRILAYAVMLLAAFGISALCLLSYAHNDALLRSMTLPTMTKWDQNIPSRILAFERRFRDAAQMEYTVKNNDIPDMGFDQSQKALRLFNKKLNSEFADDLFERASATLRNRRVAATQQTPDSEFNMLAADLVWRFDLLDSVRQGKSFDELLKIPAMPQGILDALNVGDVPLLVPSLAYSVSRYYYGITDPAVQGQILRSLHTSLSRLPTIKDNSLEWLTQRAKFLASLTPLQGGVFWRGAMSDALNSVQLDPVYTSAGFAVTMDYLNRLAMIVSGAETTPQGQNFLHWYAATYVEAWKSFALAFAQKMQELSTATMAADSMTLMSSENNPFFQLLLRMEEELRPILPWLDTVPPWIDDLALFAETLRLLKTAEEKQDPTLGKRLSAATQQLTTIFDETVDKKTKERNARAGQILKGLQACLASLHDLVRYTLAEDLAFSIVHGAMPDENNKEAATSPLILAKTNLLAFQNSINTMQEASSPVFVLNNGPLVFFTARLINSTSCHIQSLWEGNVLVKAGGVAPLQLQQALFAEPGGLARDFADKTLAYMLNHTLRGYESEKLDGTPLPFTDEFLHFLNTGIFEFYPLPQQYGVTVDAVPVDVNDEALEKPFAVTLSLDCTRQKQELTNYNSPASQYFAWQKDGCGDTKLAIRFNSVTLEVLYGGENGFVRFLHDFSYGYKTFTAADFPAQAAVLKKLGVSEITLRYKIAGAESVLRAASYTPGELPFVAAQCRR
ncbi:MAG: hypothetical protein LBN33_03685 [Desulfovibrio sp.]|jgi:type VI secretion system protein ImpL|nr:hypothetical protein [Desulfovibrio sp.]